MVRRIALLIPLALLVLGPAGAEGPANGPGAAATAWAISVTIPSGAPVATPTVVSPPDPTPAAGGPFAYPADGSIVAVQSTTATATTSVKVNASAKAESDATGISLFGGEITADGVTARASAGTGYSGAGGNANGSTVTNLKVGGQPVTGTHVALGDWGQLAIGAQGIDRTAPTGVRGYRGFVTELLVHLTADHGGLAAGSDIQIGYAQAAVQTAPPRTSTTTTPTTTTTATTSSGEAPVGDLPSLRPRNNSGSKGLPLQVQPKLTAGHYVFPVYGPSSYIDSYGSARADVTYHHGDDIFGQLGQPLLAVATGTVFSVG